MHKSVSVEFHLMMPRNNNRIMHKIQNISCNKTQFALTHTGISDYMRLCGAAVLVRRQDHGTEIITYTGTRMSTSFNSASEYAIGQISRRTDLFL